MARFCVGILLLLVGLCAFAGCGPHKEHPWAERHYGEIKDVRGFGTFLEIEFADGANFKVAAEDLRDSDPWVVGEMIILQTQERCCGRSPLWRFSGKFSETSRPQVEKTE